jgi:hypothetical protein
MVTFGVSGITFRIKEQPWLKHIKPKGFVSFLKEPTNEYDKNAVRIIYEGYHIGYVPATINKNWKHKTGTIQSYAYINDEGEFNDKDDGILQAVLIEVKEEDADTPEVLRFDDMEITYDRKSHTYSDAFGVLLSASKLPSLLPSSTERLIRWAFDNFETYEECQKSYDSSADNGSKLHELCEKAIRGEKVMHPVSNFVSRYSPKLIQTEEIVYNAKNRIVGRYDAFVEISGKRVLIDWKSGKFKKSYWVQLAFYATCLNTDEAWVVSFNTKSKQGYSISKINKEQIDEWFKVSCNLAKNYYLMQEL